MNGSVRVLGLPGRGHGEPGPAADGASSYLLADPLDDASKLAAGRAGDVRAMLPTLPALRWSSVPDRFVRLVTFFLPSFVVRSRPDVKMPSRRLHPTSHLDGIRGVAAFLVFIYHFAYTAYPVAAAYGSNPETWGIGGPDRAQLKSRWLFQLPILNLLTSGAPWVPIFFIVSGYSLSIRPLRYMRSRSWESLFTTISSATFRRGFRMYLPCLMSTFVIMWLVNLNFYEVTRRFATSRDFNPIFQENHIDKRPTWTWQFDDFYVSFTRFIWVWSFDIYGGSNHHDLHLWTISIEYRCSLVLFLCQAAFGRFRPWLRVTGNLLIIWFAKQWGRWDVMLFIAGFVLAEYDAVMASLSSAGWHSQSQSRAQSPLQEKPTRSRRRWYAWHVLFSLIMFVALVFLSYPEEGVDTSPYTWLEQRTPRIMGQLHRYWHSIGAIMFLFAVNNVAAFANVFNLAPIQYLGDISYSLYLMHGPVIHTFGYFVQMKLYAMAGFTPQDVYSYAWITAHLLSALLTIGACLWAGDVFWRAVDAPVVRLSRRLEQQLLVRDG